MSDSVRSLPDFQVRVEYADGRLADVVPSAEILSRAATAEAVYAGMAHAGMLRRAAARIGFGWTVAMSSRRFDDIRGMAVRLAPHVLGYGPARVAVYDLPVITFEFAFMLVPLRDREDPPAAPETAEDIPGLGSAYTVTTVPGVLKQAAASNPGGGAELEALAGHAADLA